MKSPIGGGKNTIQNILQDAVVQSRNIIIDLRRCKLSEEQAISKISREFQVSKHIKRIMVIKRDSEILDLTR